MTKIIQYRTFLGAVEPPLVDTFCKRRTPLSCQLYNYKLRLVDTATFLKHQKLKEIPQI